MPRYELSVQFNAADHHQAERLALAWAGTMRAEYGTFAEVLTNEDGAGLLVLGPLLDATDASSSEGEPRDDHT